MVEPARNICPIFYNVQLLFILLFFVGFCFLKAAILSSWSWPLNQISKLVVRKTRFTEFAQLLKCSSVVKSKWYIIYCIFLFALFCNTLLYVHLLLQGGVILDICKALVLQNSANLKLYCSLKWVLQRVCSTTTATNTITTVTKATTTITYDMWVYEWCLNVWLMFECIQVWRGVVWYTMV